MGKTERELEQQQENLEYSWKDLRVFVADILPQNMSDSEEIRDRMLEVENLVNTYGWVVILEHIQKRGIPDYKTYIGSGKMDEMIDEMKLQNCNLLILGNILKPSQIYNINELLKPIWAKCWDRVDLILKIFERHAKTTEARLQIELASIKHMWPRIFDMGMELGKQGGKWKWETNTEIMKRHLAKRQAAIKKDLEKYARVRAEHRKGRSRKWFLTVWIVGYTNAGKSSLLNSLTWKWVLAQDKLFATLGTSVGKLWIEWKQIDERRYMPGKEVLLNDTIWFIRDLPPKLVDAFTSTLEDSIESDLLFHVIDASDPKIADKMFVVNDILEKIWASQPRVLVFNKIDLISENTLKKLRKEFKDQDTIFVSSVNKNWFEEVKTRILKSIAY